MIRAAVEKLRSAGTVRQRAHRLLELCQEGRLDYFEIDRTKLDTTADYVADVIRANYPHLRIPYHGRWRHFAAGGIDRWGMIDKLMPDRTARVHAAIDLAVISVLLDAGAGARWRYLDRASGKQFRRSEGLAVASLEMFRSGMFSSRGNDPFRVDADALTGIHGGMLTRALQASVDNPIDGLEGRVKLLNNLALALRSQPGFFGQDGRPGHLYDCSNFGGNRIEAASILRTLLDAFSTIWPGRIVLDGENLGDVWRHGKLAYDDETAFLMPFHKLSQWLAYSLLEPLEWGGKTIVQLQDLTGLAEYRNGGLFIDAEVLRLRNPQNMHKVHAISDELVVEWRALTVALLDDLRAPVAERLGLSAAEMPLARLLEGGTWAAGRKIAGEKRPQTGAPPLKIASDGTVF